MYVRRSYMCIHVTVGRHARGEVPQKIMTSSSFTLSFPLSEPYPDVLLVHLRWQGVELLLRQGGGSISRRCFGLRPRDGRLLGVRHNRPARLRMRLRRELGTRNHGGWSRDSPRHPRFRSSTTSRRVRHTHHHRGSSARRRHLENVSKRCFTHNKRHTTHAHSREGRTSTDDGGNS